MSGGSGEYNNRKSKSPPNTALSFKCHAIQTKVKFFFAGTERWEIFLVHISYSTDPLSHKFLFNIFRSLFTADFVWIFYEALNGGTRRKFIMLQRRGIYERLIVQITFVSESLSIVLCSSTSSLVASHEKKFRTRNWHCARRRRSVKYSRFKRWSQK